MSTAAVSIHASEPIVVDLDGTLVLTDTFAASVLEALRTRPACLPAIIGALLSGRARCKKLVASLADLSVTGLPYNLPLIDYLREERSAGRRLVLATGADASIASRVAEHLGIFDDVIASDGQRNVTGDEKLRAIRNKIGTGPFLYAGNSRADLRVWSDSRSAILVRAPQSCLRRLQHAGITIEREFGGRGPGWTALIRCLRLHQWSKNILVFVPVVLSHQILNPVVLRQALLAFFALCFCASALYIINDLLDLQADRLHPAKRNRPLAAGDVSEEAGVCLSAFMAAGGAAMASPLPSEARLLLVCYAMSSFIYSFVLKRLLFFDIVSLALLYVLRVVYGGAATGITISVWTLAFSLFLFTSLAAIKRVAELRKVKPVTHGGRSYRGYQEDDVGQLASLASSGGYVAVLVLALYINSPEVKLLYVFPQGLWLLCPLLIYWISRIMLIANRGHLHDDPVTFALRDRATWVVGIAVGIVLSLSAWAHILP